MRVGPHNYKEETICLVALAPTLKRGMTSRSQLGLLLLRASQITRAQRAKTKHIYLTCYYSSASVLAIAAEASAGLPAVSPATSPVPCISDNRMRA